MKLDETEFKSFLANLQIFIANSKYDEMNHIDITSYFIHKTKISGQLMKYLQIINNQPIKSKFKQLEIKYEKS